ncbi:MAG: Gfo/Idh/MocA family oxidoreductase [Verrucomicrobia bacterium]|jgi:predicted dehydrogenase|nr:Gfo/Idh/MocA family oxidoreductase [Verrucomicrobiota bacterium]OQC66075.1 MAG: Glucose--fructose oxidoreductase precursor [Verrucomicrobia bacterium ADurb.Bin006]MDI9381903.1 Gfo/Idh/MocA family oxidoreductase [Verrucomicrobiota bacterium]NMD21831.1 Gfo/Idh/MocA family oxidoreductase [Verrucomicrobiota bacterium]HOA63004.1 Gfo/Idh/MocA family oxidoreductase [Verrucomicrobiota bacterium]
MNNVSRRNFLRQSSVFAAGLPLAGGLVLSPFPRAAAASEKVRVALIGSGAMGRGDLATFFLNPEVDCPVVCDVDDKQLAEAVKLVKEKRDATPDTVKDFRRVLERKDVDAVVVATPDHWHALPTVLACQAGKDVYVEKPLALTIAEGRAMIEAAQRHNRVCQMGAQRLSSPTYAQAVDFVKTGKLGKVGLVRAWAYLDWIRPIGSPADGPVPPGVDYDMWLGPAPDRPFNSNRFHFNFRWFWDYAGGLMTDWGVHLIQVLLWAMGPEPPKSVMSSGGKYVLEDNSETPDTQITVYEFPTYTLVWEHKVGVGLGLYNRPWGMSFTGTEGTLVINDSGWEILREPTKDALEPKKYPGGADPRPAHVRNFLDCIKSRQQPIENLGVGHHVSTVAHLGNIALRTGHKVNWDTQAERVIADPKADALVSVSYRKPWQLPYLSPGR